ncbi:MAG: hypothetical protein HY842_16745 [Bacteroidetes bacterium]|nr:hypothetical protein [Bacteroidota bacterium]
MLIAAPKDSAGAFGALLEAYRENQVGVDFFTYGEHLPSETELAEAASGMDAVLFIVPGNRAPRTVVSGPFLLLKNGRKIPLGVLPAKNKESLGKFAAAAAHAQLRRKDSPSVALLSQRHPHYTRVSNRIETILQTSDATYPVFKWTSDIVLREDMLAGINGGLGLALYLGHGRPIGWVGYYGMRAHHFDEYLSHPLGGLISLCCHTASRRRTGLSFSESIVLKGAAASALGAVTSTQYADNTRWAVQLVDTLLTGVTTIGELIVKGLPMKPAAVNPYRLIGDPLAPIHAPAEGIELAKTINIYS